MAEKKLMHVERIPIRWGDMDAMGHVNNTVYFRYMEQTRIVVVRRAGAGGRGVEGHRHRHRQRVVQFQARAQLPGHVAVSLSIEPPGGSSVGTFYELKMGDALYADGAAVVVFIDMKSQKPVRIPERIRSLLQ